MTNSKHSSSKSNPLLKGLLMTTGADLFDKITSSKILLVGAGGIGCELLKNLALSGFTHVEVIDLDTIDVSNLNRQFLFRSQHVGMPKCTVACAAALAMLLPPSLTNDNSNDKSNQAKYSYTAHHGNVCDNSRFNVNFVKGFDLVLNALDNVAARRRVNRLCLAAAVPLVEAGTTGYLGQVTVIDKQSNTECYECQAKPTQKVYPICTIRSTPSMPVHTIVWAKELYKLLFGPKVEESMLFEDQTGDEKSTYMDLVMDLRSKITAAVSVGNDDDDDDNNNNNTLNMNNMNSSNSNDSDPMMAILPSPSMNYSSIIVSKPKHNVATLASPILAAVGLEPRVHSSSSSSTTTTTGTTRTGTTRTRMYKKKSKRPSPSSKSTASNTTNTYTTNTNNTNTNNTTSYTTTPLVAILTSDGLIHTRSPSFISIPLSTIEVGNQPNDFFTLTSIQNSYQQQQQQMQMQIIASSYSGESRLIYFAQDTKQDLADRMMKLCIDAFGLKGFPRTELADAIQASFTATTYVGEKANVSSKNLLKQYLETVLGLDMSCDFGGGGAIYKRFLYGDDDNEYDDEDDDNEYDDDYNHVEDESSQIMIEDDHEHNHVKDENEHTTTNVSNSSFASSFLSATAILCLVCTQLTSPNATLANRAAKSCANKFGVVGTIQATSINHATVQLCEIIAEQLILQSNTKRQITPPASNSGLATGRDGINMNMVEAATWLLRCCGKHESAIDIILERMNNPSMRNKTFTEESVSSSSGIGFVHTMHNNNMNSTSNSNNTRGTSLGWSQYKYESYISLHLVDLWSYGHHEECRDLVLKSKATRQLLETNPKLGLKIFTSLHPTNEKQWLVVIPRGAEPISDIKSVPTQVVELLKSIRPHIPYNSNSAININKGLDVSSQSVEVRGNDSGSDSNLPLESGRALAVVYLESLVGISTGRPPVSNNVNSNYGDDNFHSVVTDIHNELAFLLLEGVLSERTEDDENVDSDLGKIYREKLRRLLGWHSSKVQPDVLMEALPSTFLREKALLLGQLGRHEDALRIFYFDLKSLELALEYCDARYEKQQVHSVYERKQSFNQLIGGKSKGGEDGCAYLPLVRIALESDQDSERGIAAAIKVLSLRRETINRGAALRLLPKNVPVSALARPFLIPALIDSESQSRRLTVASSLLRAKYVRLKHALTEAQIKSQSYLPNVPALQSLNLGDPVYASKPFKARPSNMSTLHFPDVTITKHFFSRYVVIQATATTTDEMSLNDVQLVVAESSDEALLPSVNVPIKTLPPRITGSSWCVLAASPQRLDGTAILVCEMHYTVPALDSATNVPLNFNTGIGFSSGSSSGRPYVEELQDIEIRRAEFDGF